MYPCPFRKKDESPARYFYALAHENPKVQLHLERGNRM